MSAIIFLEINNSNHKELAKIIQKFSSFNLNQDGRFLIENGRNELDGDVCSDRVYIIVFSSIEKANEWCKSEEFLSLEIEKDNYRMMLIDKGKSNDNIGNEITYLLSNQINQIQSDRYSKIRNIYKNSYKFTELQTIKHQICICITLSLNIAAMTLTNHLLEKLMKFALIYDDSKKKKRNRF